MPCARIYSSLALADYLYHFMYSFRFPKGILEFASQHSTFMLSQNKVHPATHPFSLYFSYNIKRNSTIKNGKNPSRRKPLRNEVYFQLHSSTWGHDCRFAAQTLHPPEGVTTQRSTNCAKVTRMECWWPKVATLFGCVYIYIYIWGFKRIWRRCWRSNG